MIIKYFDLRQFAKGFKNPHYSGFCLLLGGSQCQPTRELSGPFNHDSLCGCSFHCFLMNSFLQLALAEGASRISPVLQNRKRASRELGLTWLSL